MLGYDAERINKIIDLLDIRVQADGGEVDAVCENAVYKSMDTKVATVDANGVISLVGKGTTKVQVTATVNGVLLRGEIEVIADERK